MIWASSVYVLPPQSSAPLLSSDFQAVKVIFSVLNGSKSKTPSRVDSVGMAALTGRQAGSSDGEQL